jgi:hypothetical protein
MELISVLWHPSLSLRPLRGSNNSGYMAMLRSAQLGLLRSQLHIPTNRYMKWRVMRKK